MGLRDGPEAAELGIGEAELDPLVARLVVVAPARHRACRGRLLIGLLDGPLSPGGGIQQCCGILRSI